MQLLSSLVGSLLTLSSKVPTSITGQGTMNYFFQLREGVVFDLIFVIVTKYDVLKLFKLSENQKKNNKILINMKK